MLRYVLCCLAILLMYILTGFQYQSGSGSCTTLGYCSSYGNSAHEFIDNVAIGNIQNLSANDGGYGDFTVISTTLYLGESHVINVSPGFTDTSRNIGVAVFIDYNQDGQFQPTETVLTSNGLTNNTLSGRFIVPDTIALGSTRMRVSIAYGAIPQACDTSHFGEVEDYCVTLEQRQVISNCPIVATIQATETMNNEVICTWAETADVERYMVSYMAMSDKGWKHKFTYDNQVALEDLDYCTKYEWTVSAICNSVVGSTSEIGSFSIGQCYLVNSVATAFENPINVYPNPFSNQVHLSGLPKHTSITISNLLGEEVGQIKTEMSNQITLHTEHWPKGVYFLSFPESKGLRTQRLIKQ